ncbi:hypothetical protein BD309DRAFT_219481 [Dichomitus squalens]|nr:hypothetical protein BD309DRAFT_219481 [Dichomitus squalens]
MPLSASVTASPPERLLQSDDTFNTPEISPPFRSCNIATYDFQFPSGLPCFDPSSHLEPTAASGDSLPFCYRIFSISTTTAFPTSIQPQSSPVRCHPVVAYVHTRAVLSRVAPHLSCLLHHVTFVGRTLCRFSSGRLSRFHIFSATILVDAAVGRHRELLDDDICHSYSLFSLTRA